MTITLAIWVALFVWHVTLLNKNDHDDGNTRDEPCESIAGENTEGVDCD